MKLISIILILSLLRVPMGDNDRLLKTMTEYRKKLISVLRQYKKKVENEELNREEIILEIIKHDTPIFSHLKWYLKGFRRSI